MKSAPDDYIGGAPDETVSEDALLGRLYQYLLVHDSMFECELAE